MKGTKNDQQKPSDNIEMKPQNSHETSNAHNILQYARKRSILRKLMICQRKKFMLKKEQADFNRMKKNLADTSISNFSQAEGFVNNNFNGYTKSEKENMNVNSANDADNVEQVDNIKYFSLFCKFDFFFYSFCNLFFSNKIIDYSTMCGTRQGLLTMKRLTNSESIFFTFHFKY
jgi:hypothetical protein